MQSSSIWLAVLVPLILLAVANERSRGRLALAALAGALVALGPWMARNAALFGDASLFTERDVHQLAGRLQYLSLSLADGVRSIAYFTPGLGPDAASGLYPRGLIERLAGVHAGATPPAGASRIAAGALAAHPDPGGALRHLVADRIAAEPAAYLATMLPAIYRGFWGAGTPLVLLAACYLVPLWRGLGMAAAEPRGPLLGLVLAAVALLLVGAALTPNGYHMHPLMLVLIAYAVARAAGSL